MIRINKLTCAAALIGIAILATGTGYLSAQTTEAEQLQRAIQEKNANLEQLNREIAQYEALADKTGQEAKTLQSRIKQLEQNAKSIDLDIRKTNGKIDVANLDIRRISLDIGESEERVKLSRESIENSIREIHMADQTSLAEIFLNNKNLSVTLEEVNSQLNFNNALQKLVTDSRREQEILNNTKLSQEEKKKELQSLQNELSSKKKAVEYTKSEQNDVLKATKNQEQAYQKILKDKVALKAATEKELFEYESKL
ncbi:MAG TPA: hypothetical protein VGE62_02955, partial [Candidatus Paceibacterota bacterium]